MLRRHFLEKSLSKPSAVYTIGPDYCDYTSLGTALENSNECDTFIVFGGTHDGKLNLRKDQSIHCIGKVTLKQSANDYLFYFRQPSDYDAGNPSLYEVHWSGSLPFVQFYSDSRWVYFENDFLATIDMSSFYLHHIFNFSQQDTNPFTINSVTSNLIVDSSWFDPEFLDTGINGLKIFAEVNYVPPASKQFLSIQSSATNRILIYTRDVEAYYVNINSFDFSGNLANTISGFMECKVLFYFENM
ncbi:MAG: hypothetical protein P8Z35_21945 [Ignavibacteriaceae bacterium]